MRRFRLLFVGAAIASLLATGTYAHPRLLERLRGGDAPRSSTGAVSQTLSFGGIERSYLLLDAHRGSEPAPLVIVLHGGGGTPETMIPRWADKARAAGLVVVAPKGVGRTDRMGTWNASGCCGEALSRGVDDVAYIGAVIDHVSKRTTIDPKRIYVTGFSNGAMLTHRIAIALGNRIAAAAVVSGAIFGNEPAPRSPVPMLIMHGEQDPVVGFNGGMSQTGFVAKQQALPFRPVRDAVNYWRLADGCSLAPVVTNQPGVKVERSTDCRSGVEVLFYDLPNGTHSWPGSAGRHGFGESSPTAATINATDVIWDFFKDHRR